MVPFHPGRGGTTNSSAFVLFVLNLCCSLIGRRDEVDSERSLMEEDNPLESNITYGATTQADKVCYCVK